MDYNNFNDEEFNSINDNNEFNNGLNERQNVNVNNDKDRLRKVLFDMVSVGVVGEPLNQFYDVISIGALLLNITAAIMSTYDSFSKYSGTFKIIEAVTVAFFAVDYVLRFITAKYQYPMEKSEAKATVKYVTSFFGIIDLLSFLPYYLPIVFPAGAVAFRMIRVVRILRLFRINAYYDSLNVIADVISAKKQQLISSVFIIVVLMIASSMCMYSLEHEAQPDVFENAFSGIWWATSTLLTVGYGDIYPVTLAGRIMGIFISFLGVGMVAIPTGIISAGFVEQYSRIKRLGEYAKEEEVRFISAIIKEDDEWAGVKVKDLDLPESILIAMIKRGNNIVIPKGHVVIEPGDNVIMAARSANEDSFSNIKEITLGKKHKWVNEKIKDLDISKQSHIIVIIRGDESVIPSGRTVLLEGDKVVMYSKVKLAENE